MGLRLATALGACLLAVILAWALRGGHDAPVRDTASSTSVVETGSEAPAAPGALSTIELADAEAAQPDRTRAPQSGSRDPAAALGDIQTGTLAVLVRNARTGRPVRDVRLTLRPANANSDASPDIAGSRPRPGDRPRTDAEGRAELELPLGQAHFLSARPSDRSVDPLTREIPALATPERIEVLLELPNRYDLPFVGRVVAAESGAPLADAQASVVDSTFRSPGSRQLPRETVAEAEADASGTFEVLVPSWDAIHARVVAPDRSEVLVKVTPGHEVRARALEIRLARSATLDVLALGEDERPLERVEVRLSTPSYEVDQAEGFAASLIVGDVHWSGVTDGQGRCTIEGLPPQAHLSLEHHLDAGVVRRDATQLVLEPGERREIVFRLGSGGILTGQLVGLDGAPVPDAEVWLLTDNARRPRRLSGHEDDQARVQTSDRDGRFVFVDLADGYWLVGPSPRGPFAPEAELVEILDGVPDRELILAAQRGLFIRGAAVDPTGAPVPGVFLIGMRDGRLGVSPNGPSDSRGRFELGPLVEGRYRISAILSPHTPPGLSPGEPIEVQAGAEDVRVELRPGASLRGVLVDGATGAPLEGDIVLSAAAAQDGPRSSLRRHGRADRDGHFEIDGIPPGTYDLAAAGGGLAVVVRGVEVQAGAEGPELTLRAQPGAKVAVCYEGDEPYAGYTVFAAGAAVASNGLRSGSEEVHVVPAGPIRVECTWKGLETPRVRELTLQVGERGEAAFGRDE